LELWLVVTPCSQPRYQSPDIVWIGNEKIVQLLGVPLGHPGSLGDERWDSAA
jgi:hypothetical protein